MKKVTLYSFKYDPLNSKAWFTDERLSVEHLDSYLKNEIPKAKIKFGKKYAWGNILPLRAIYLCDLKVNGVFPSGVEVEALVEQNSFGTWKFGIPLFNCVLDQINTKKLL